jgi:hypothetical protein
MRQDSGGNTVGDGYVALEVSARLPRIVRCGVRSEPSSFTAQKPHHKRAGPFGLKSELPGNTFDSANVDSHV